MISKDQIKSYFELTKPRIIHLVLVTTALGYYLGDGKISLSLTLLWTLLGTTLCCAGSAALNQYLERDFDALMKRTANRPLPSKAIPPQNALAFGVILVLMGTASLVLTVNLLTGFMAILTAFLYVVVYTPLKRVSWINTGIGAIPGALPTVGGWTAATGELSIGAWLLFLILFVWQHPHFYAIAWMYKDDYAKGGFKMLPVVEPDGKRTFRQILAFSALLIPVSIFPTLFGISGYFYLTGALLLGSFMLWSGYMVWKTHEVSDARKVLRMSIFYLPILLLLVVVDSGLFGT